LEAAAQVKDHAADHAADPEEKDSISSGKLCIKVIVISGGLEQKVLKSIKVKGIKVEGIMRPGSSASPRAWPFPASFPFVVEEPCCTRSNASLSSIAKALAVAALITEKADDDIQEAHHKLWEH
jgi:hypothetical protein